VKTERLNMFTNFKLGRAACENPEGRSLASRMLIAVPAAILGGFVFGYWRACRQRHERVRRMDDAVDQAVLDSFPASDPPAFAGGSVLSR